MKKNFLILSVLCVMKQTEESEIVDQGKPDNICILTVDKDQKRVMRKYEQEGATIILSQEDGKWYSYVDVGDGNLSKKHSN